MEIRKKNTQYFKQRLREHLYESFPQLTDDIRLIDQRARWAFNAYEGAMHGGNSESKSMEIAIYILMEGFHFSKFDTVLEVLNSEFSDRLPQAEHRALALKLLPVCESAFERYELTDDFVYNIEHDLLYLELIETINIWLIQNGIQ